MMSGPGIESEIPGVGVASFQVNSSDVIILPVPYPNNVPGENPPIGVII
jgi:hypothetical protein